jgi:hypothetical protein
MDYIIKIYITKNLQCYIDKDIGFTYTNMSVIHVAIYFIAHLISRHGSDNLKISFGFYNLFLK